MHLHISEQFFFLLLNLNVSYFVLQLQTDKWILLFGAGIEAVFWLKGFSNWIDSIVNSLSNLKIFFNQFALKCNPKYAQRFLKKLFLDTNYLDDVNVDAFSIYNFRRKWIPDHCNMKKEWVWLNFRVPSLGLLQISWYWYFLLVWDLLKVGWNNWYVHIKMFPDIDHVSSFPSV